MFISVDFITALIVSGATTANPVNLMGRQLVGVRVPGNLSGTGMSFKVGITEGDTLYPLASGAAVMQEGVSGSAVSWFSPERHIAYNFVQVAITGTAQGTAQRIDLLVRPVS
jgi:hypothetical protein